MEPMVTATSCAIWTIWRLTTRSSSTTSARSGSIEEHRRVVETNLLGLMYASHTVLGHFCARGRGQLWGRPAMVRRSHG